MSAAMIQDPNFIPILQTYGWDGKPHVPCKSLYSEQEPEENDDVFFSYGVSSPEKISFIMRNTLAQEGIDLKQVDFAAKQNLLRYITQLEWQPVNYENYQALVLAGNSSTAAAVCLSDFLKQIHDYFNNDTIYLGIPNRFTLLASDNSYQFAQSMKQMYEEAIEKNHGALSPHLIVMQNGQILGQAQLDAEPQAAEVPPEINLADSLPRVEKRPKTKKPKLKAKRKGATRSIRAGR